MMTNEEKQQLTHGAIFLESRSRTLNINQYIWQNENIEGHARYFFFLIFIIYIFVFKGRRLSVSIFKLYDNR
jgi:hypothetical protein